MFYTDKRQTARWRRVGLALAIAAFGSAAAANAASAATFTVNDPADAPLSNPTGTACESTEGGSCTLRAAVQAADNAGGSSTIDLGAQTYKLTIPAESGKTEDAAVGDLDVNEGVDLTIVGQGPTATTIDADHVDRAFAVHESASLSISGATIENGSQPDSSPSDYSIEAGYGGAFYNAGSLAIENCALEGNSATDGGGAVYTTAEAAGTSITNSTVDHNAADDAGGALYVEGGTLTLQGDQVVGNDGDDEGGALYVEERGKEAPVTISSSTISDNLADSDGGAADIEYARSLTISDSALSNNSAGYDDDGGAIYVYESGTLRVSGSTFEDDSAGGYDEEGGAIYDDYTDLSMSGSRFVGNTSGYAGAIYVDGTSASAVESITTSTFAGNHAEYYYGGAIYVSYGDLELTRSTLADNSAYDGGALYYESEDGMQLSNDTFDGNTAVEGGALYLDEEARTGSIELVNDTIARNTAYDGGGIAYAYYANAIKNTIVAENTGAFEDGDCYDGAHYDGSTADQGGNIDSDGTCFSKAVAGDQTEVDPLLGPLTENGGPTSTDALLPNSPAIGKALGASCPTEDQRGLARSAGSCDVGAYQAAQADLSVSVAGLASVTQGDATVYTVTVKNNGPAPTGGVSLTDSLPAGTSLYSVGPSQGSCSGTSTLSCSLGVLEDGASATVVITVAANTAGTATDTATVTGTERDPNGANNSASASTVVNAAASGGSSGGGGTKAVMAPPQASTGRVSEITKGSALISATVNPEGSATSWHLAIGTSKKRLTRLTASQSAGSGTTALGVLALLKGLKPGQRYYVEVVAVNAHGTVKGKLISFKTAGKAKKKQKKHSKQKHKK